MDRVLRGDGHLSAVAQSKDAAMCTMLFAMIVTSFTVLALLLVWGSLRLIPW